MTPDIGRRTALKAIGATGAAFALGGIGTAGARGTARAKGRSIANERRRQGASTEPTIVELATDAENLNILVAAVKEAGLADALSGNRQLTVFAPTDNAFEALADELDVEPEDLLDRDDLAEILLYHVTPGRRYADSVLGAPRLRMLNREFVTQDDGVLLP
ncbi:Surface protein containing fasciclin-like repeats [Halapricum desulfuricans]|uniref:Surface protein containing fasciclin-like repeats n=1 Tax=Halapricum desulfuricans TaxID=2841257 RepID=A0A897NM11_9EURY|nr:fasciclin domain-containing protein [Halapricum desulfuricans]QSG11963.1 Surface protein containing fasciclin-like repeats [Halapricum desulfuricans]